MCVEGGGGGGGGGGVRTGKMEEGEKKVARDTVTVWVIVVARSGPTHDAVGFD